MTYSRRPKLIRKPLVWLEGEIKTPPFSAEARIEAGTWLGAVQEGHALGMPYSRPMPQIGSRCYELRVRDKDNNWRIVYRIDDDAIVIGEVFKKTTQRTPKQVISNCQRRFSDYDNIIGRRR